MNSHPRLDPAFYEYFWALAQIFFSIHVGVLRSLKISLTKENDSFTMQQLRINTGADQILAFWLLANS